jgi:hypothetical protein
MTYGSQMPVVLFNVDCGQYAPRGQAAHDSIQEKSAKNIDSV